MTHSDAGFALNTWDVAPERTPYCCSFHWFRLPDGRIVGIDAIRSDDTGRLGLRAFLVAPDGDIRGMSHAAPENDWYPFTTNEKPSLDGDRPALGRGPCWVAGAVRDTGQGLDSVVFDLEVVTESKGHSSSLLWDLDFVDLAATDFMLAHTTGWLELDGERFEIDSRGPVSLHLGAKLPEYGYCATVPQPDRPAAPGLLLASVDGDNLRVFGKLLDDVGFTYAYGDHGVPHRLYSIGRFDSDCIPVDFIGHIELSDIRPFRHELLDVATITATADAVLRLPLHDDVALGRLILDYRGPLYTTTLSVD